LGVVLNWTIIPADEWRKRVRSTLIQNASALIEIDRKIVKAIVESSFENLSALISEFRDKKIEVQKSLIELGTEMGDVGEKATCRVRRERWSHPFEEIKLIAEG